MWKWFKEKEGSKKENLYSEETVMLDKVISELDLIIKQSKDLISQQETNNKYDECGHSSCISVLKGFVKRNEALKMELLKKEGPSHDESGPKAKRRDK